MSDPQEDVPGEADGAWNCPACTFYNQNDVFACEMCRTMNPAAPAPPMGVGIAGLPPWMAPIFAMAGAGGGGMQVGIGGAGGPVPMPAGPGPGISEAQLRDLLAGVAGGAPLFNMQGGDLNAQIQGLAQGMAEQIAQAMAGALGGGAFGGGGAGGPDGPVDPAPQGLIDSLEEVCLDKETIDGGNGECGICLAEQHVGDLACVLECGHAFHKETCLRPWLERNCICPVCRLPLSRTRSSSDARTRHRERIDEQRERHARELHEARQRMMDMEQRERANSGASGTSRGESSGTAASSSSSSSPPPPPPSAAAAAAPSSSSSSSAAAASGATASSDATTNGAWGGSPPADARGSPPVYTASTSASQHHQPPTDGGSSGSTRDGSHSHTHSHSQSYSHSYSHSHSRSDPPHDAPASREQLEGFAVRELKRRLDTLGVPYAGIVEKKELVELLLSHQARDEERERK